MPKQPEDHKPAKDAPFKFTTKGKTYTLPDVMKGKDSLTGRDFRDAVMGGEVGQMAYTFKLLEAAGPSEAALNALYAMPQAEMMDVVGAWGEHGDGDGASLGESEA